MSSGVRSVSCEGRLSRRCFMQAVGSGVALGTIGSGKLSASPASRPADTPLFRFVQWNDVHCDESQPPGYQLANEKMRYLVDWVRSPNGLPRPDFVVGVGDMVHGGSLDAIRSDLLELWKILAPLDIPFYPVVGNHENVQQEGDPQHEAGFRDTFGKDRTNYTLKHKGVLFIMLNNSGAPQSNSKAVGRRRNEWFEATLAASPDVPKIVCCHIPLIPLREESVLAKSFGFSSYAAQDEQLLKLVDQHARSVVAVLSGHLHLTAAVVRHGVLHICLSGTASYPCDFGVYDVFADRVQLRVHSLPGNLVTPYTNIHGRRRHGVDYTDSLHRDHEAYVRGNASERVVDIRMTRDVQPVQE